MSIDETWWNLWSKSRGWLRLNLNRVEASLNNSPLLVATNYIFQLAVGTGRYKQVLGDRQCLCTIRSVSNSKNRNHNTIYIISLSYKHDTVAARLVRQKFEMQTAYPIYRLIYDDRHCKFDPFTFLPSIRSPASVFNKDLWCEQPWLWSISPSQLSVI